MVEKEVDYGVFLFVKKIKDKISKPFRRDSECRNRDTIKLNLDGLEIFLDRCFAYNQPDEVSIVVPRAELRKKFKKDDKEEKIEILLNSITVVHSPQKSSNNNGDEEALEELPEIPRRDID